ncbi:hypothetical protein N7490_006724 [Penicillium lividum]|nr:hypothetical protein N7490_006724 [Penicillium lividum]
MDAISESLGQGALECRLQRTTSFRLGEMFGYLQTAQTQRIMAKEFRVTSAVETDADARFSTNPM